MNWNLCAQGPSEGGEGPQEEGSGNPVPFATPSAWRCVFASPLAHWRLLPRLRAPAPLSVFVLWRLQAVGVWCGGGLAAHSWRWPSTCTGFSPLFRRPPFLPLSLPGGRRFLFPPNVQSGEQSTPAALGIIFKDKSQPEPSSPFVNTL